MRRFEPAIKVIQDEIYRHIGKVATKYVDKSINPSIAVSELKCKNLKEAIRILESHERNTHV